MKPHHIFLFFAVTFSVNVVAQNESHSLTINLSVDKSVQKEMKKSGRLFIFINQNPNVEPRRMMWPSAGSFIFAKNMSSLDARKGAKLPGDGWSKTRQWDLSEIPDGEYYVQILWDQDKEESRHDAPGNLYSEKQKVSITNNTEVEFVLSKVIEPRTIVKHELVREIDIQSDTLSKWWGKPVHVKATILLPAGYKEGEKKEYPIRYNVAGYGGRYDRINYIVKENVRGESVRFLDWWTSDEAPRIINVFLDGEGPFGDSYQMDSENSGPYGYSLVYELIPAIEKKYRGTESPETFFVDGCSTGGWVSLGLQLYYPDVFNGVFSYSPDAIEFENYQLINIYKDKNAYTNEYGYTRPVMRETSGEPMMTLREFIQYENVLGSSDSYLNSGGQFSAHTALYSPKGKNGLPKPLFDPVTGEVDHTVAEHWKKYDFKIYCQENWKELGPKLQGKIYVWMGDMDHFYLNLGTRAFDEFLKTTQDPVSDAKIEFSPTKGHCADYSNKRVLLQIKDRLKEISASK